MGKKRKNTPVKVSPKPNNTHSNGNVDLGAIHSNNNSSSSSSSSSNNSCSLFLTPRRKTRNTSPNISRARSPSHVLVPSVDKSAPSIRLEFQKPLLSTPSKLNSSMVVSSPRKKPNKSIVTPVLTITSPITDHGSNVPATMDDSKIVSDREELTQEYADRLKQLLNISAEYRCPLTGELMLDPVYIVEDFQQSMFERKSLEKWLADNDTVPITSQPIREKTINSSASFVEQLANYREQTAVECIKEAWLLLKEQKGMKYIIPLLDHSLKLLNIDPRYISRRIDALKCKAAYLLAIDLKGTSLLQVTMQLMALLEKEHNKEMINYIKQVILFDMKDLMNDIEKKEMTQYIIKYWEEMLQSYSELELEIILRDCSQWIGLSSQEVQVQFIKIILSNQHLAKFDTLIFTICHVDCQWNNLKDMLGLLYNFKQAELQYVEELDAVILKHLSDTKYSDIGQSEKSQLGIEYYRWRNKLCNMKKKYYNFGKLLLRLSCELDKSNEAARELFINHATEMDAMKEMLQVMSRQMNELMKVNSDLRTDALEKEKKIDRLLQLNAELKRDTTFNSEQINNLVKMGEEAKSFNGAKFGELIHSIESLKTNQSELENQYGIAFKDMASYVKTLQYKITKLTKEKNALLSFVINSENTNKLQVMSIIAENNCLKGTATVGVRKDDFYGKEEGKVYTSDVFSLCGLLWRLKIYPKGPWKKGSENYCAVYLALQALGEATFQVKANVKIKLQPTKIQYQSTMVFNAGGASRGTPSFCSTSQLCKKSSESKDDIFRIKVHITSIQQFKNNLEQEVYNSRHNIVI
jgi:hypothetical protein